MSEIPRTLWAAMAVIGAVLVLIAFLTGGGDGSPGGGRAAVEPATFGDALADPVPYDGRSPQEPATAERRVLVELPRPALGARGDAATMTPARRHAYVRSLREESAALRSALAARGLKLGDVVTYDVVWNGFAATVATKDLARLTSLGVRTRAVRRFFPAVSEPVPVGGVARRAPAASGGAPQVAVLAGGAAGLPGYDAVDRDADPAPGRDPRAPDREATSALGPLAVLAAAGRRAWAVRISALRAGPDGQVEEFARTDELLLGLERTVDPDGDGDPSDAVAVALVAVAAPYAGFAHAPEADAATAAGRLGTRVVAPAGHEGPAAGPYGTIGSPAAAAGALAVTALSDPAAIPRATLRVDAITVRGAAVLGGSPPAEPLITTAPLTAEQPGELAHVAAGRLAVVRAGPNPAAQAEAAAAAGAKAVLLAQPDPRRRLAAMPAGRVAAPVIGVTGTAAAAILQAGAGRRATIGRPAAPRGARPAPFGGHSLGPFPSRGPALNALRKPDLAAPASVLAARSIVSGTGIAAAAVAARTTLPAPGGGRAARVAPPVAAPVGRPRLDRRAGRTTGVRFTLGAFVRGDPAAGRPTRIVPVERLELTLVSSAGGDVARTLTPPGGELGLLPGEYAYRLPATALKDLAGGAYRFRVRAWSPRSRRPTERTSEAFAVA